MWIESLCLHYYHYYSLSRLLKIWSEFWQRYKKNRLFITNFLNYLYENRMDFHESLSWIQTQLLKVCCSDNFINCYKLLYLYTSVQKKCHPLQKKWHLLQKKMSPVAVKMSPLKKSNSHNIKLYDFYLNMIHFILNFYNKYLVAV